VLCWVSDVFEIRGARDRELVTGDGRGLGREMRWDDAYDGRVAGIIGVVQEPVVFGLGDGLDLLQVAHGDGIPH
jgi:hypothetical protein